MDILDLVKTFLPIILSAIAVIIAWRKAPSEAKKNEAEAASEYAATAQRYAELVHDQRTQIDSMEAKQHDMEERLNKALLRISELERELEEVKVWNRELCEQLRAQKVTPVPIETVRKQINERVQKRKVGANREP